MTIKSPLTDNSTLLKAPFPWFGGKSKVAQEVWSRFGDAEGYVEPFAGSLAALLARPGGAAKVETVNDMDGYLVNFWRAIKAEPEAVAKMAEHPVSELDLTARHIWLVSNPPDRARLEADPEYYSIKHAAYWIYGINAWIGTGFCSGKGPWKLSDDGACIEKGDNGQGINRQLPHMSGGRGINRQLPHLGDNGQGINTWQDRYEYVKEMFGDLADRLRNVRVACGDFERVLGLSARRGGLRKNGIVAVFLDPPYSADNKVKYSAGSDKSIAGRARDWAIANGEDKALRIALCGYEGEHDMPTGWVKFKWKANGGFSNQSGGENNATKEVIWFSPHCINPKVNTDGLFE